MRLKVDFREADRLSDIRNSSQDTDFSLTINLLTVVEDDGLVMCADSILTLTGSQFDESVVTTFEGADKIIELGTHLPAAAMISGAADIDGRLVSSFLRDVSRAIDSDASITTHSQVAQAVTAALDPAYAAFVNKLKDDAATYFNQVDRLAKINDDLEAKGLPKLPEISPDQIGVEGDPTPSGREVMAIAVPILTIVVCTYFEQDGAAAEELRWPGPLRATIWPGPDSLSYWGSGSSAIDRLVRGFDLDLIKSHIGSAVAPGSYDAGIVLDYATFWENHYLMPTAVSSMPLQDAVEFTEYLGTVACGYDRFKLGPASVGGPLDILVLRRDKRTWIRRKRISKLLATS